MLAFVGWLWPPWLVPGTFAPHLIAMAAAIFTVQDINMATLPNNAHIQRGGWGVGGGLQKEQWLRPG